MALDWRMPSRYVLAFMAFFAMLNVAASDDSQSPRPFPIPDGLRYELAEQHANCAGVYSVLYQWAKQRETQMANAKSLQKDYHLFLKIHLEYAFALYGSETKAKDQIEAARTAFIADLVNGVSVKDKPNECMRLNVRTANINHQLAPK